jgi:hypothetical protein
MRLPLDWPRINQFPEWFTAEPNRTYTIQNVSSGARVSYTGQALQAGIPVTLQPDAEVRLVITSR